MKSNNETIIHFKNGRSLHVSHNIYDEIILGDDGLVELQWSNGEGVWFEVRFRQKDVLYIGRTTQNTSSPKN